MKFKIGDKVKVNYKKYHWDLFVEKYRHQVMTVSKIFETLGKEGLIMMNENEILWEGKYLIPYEDTLKIDFIKKREFQI